MLWQMFFKGATWALYLERKTKQRRSLVRNIKKRRIMYVLCKWNIKRTATRVINVEHYALGFWSINIVMFRIKRGERKSRESIKKNKKIITKMPRKIITKNSNSVSVWRLRVLTASKQFEPLVGWEGRRFYFNFEQNKNRTIKYTETWRFE